MGLVVQLTNQRAHDLDTFRHETDQQKANTDLLIQEFDSKVAKVKQQHQRLLEKGVFAFVLVTRSNIINGAEGQA